MGGSLTDVEEEEISLKPGIPTFETRPKKPIRRAEQEREDCGHVVYRNWNACVKGHSVERRHHDEPLKEEEKERTKLPLVSLESGLLTQENADAFPIMICRDRFFCVDTFPVLIRRDDGQSQTKVTRCEREDSIPYLSPFLVDWRII